MGVQVVMTPLTSNDDQRVLVSKINRNLASIKSAFNNIENSELPSGGGGSPPPSTPEVTIPTKLSQLQNDVGYINTEIDPTVYPISYDDIMNL